MKPRTSVEIVQVTRRKKKKVEHGGSPGEVSGLKQAKKKPAPELA